MGLNGQNLKSLNRVNFISNNSKGCVLEVDLGYPKELRELYNDYPLTPNKIEIKKEILSSYQLKIADFYDIPIGDNRKNLCLIFLKKKSMCSITRTCNFTWGQD